MAPWFKHQPVLASALPISSITWTYVGSSISPPPMARGIAMWNSPASAIASKSGRGSSRSEEHTSELQSPCNLVCRLLLEKKKKNKYYFSSFKKNKKKQKI